MNSQEVFDFVATHLRTQERRAISISGRCKYRMVEDDTVLRCAAGCLITDQNYDETLEGEAVRDVLHMINASQGVQWDRESPQVALLADLQMMHDGQEVWHWETSLRMIANRYGLIYAEQTTGVCNVEAV